MFERIPQKKGSASLYLLLLIAVAPVMAMLKECSSKQLPPRSELLAGGDTVNVAIEISPMGVTMRGDSLGGVYYTMLQQIANEHGMPLKFHPFTQLETALRGLDEGRYRLVVSDIPATTELKQRYLFVDPVGIDRQVLVQRRDTINDSITITTQFGLANQQVVLPKGSPFISRLRNLSHEIGDTIYIVEDSAYSSEQLVILTALGELPRVVVSERVATPMLERYPQLDASIGISFNQFHGWVLAHSDSTLRDTLSAWFAPAPHETE